jgi:hypothetical protein
MARTHRCFNTFRVVFALLAVLVVASCRPCGCTDCEMDQASILFAKAATGQNVTGATFHFDYNPFTPFDDSFSLDVTYTPPGGSPVTETVSGTYHKSDDTVTFKASKGSSTLFQNGVAYTLTCVGKQLKFHRPNVVQDLSFICSD